MSSWVKTRADDEWLLRLVRLRAAGWSSAQIGTAAGVASSAVRTATNRVRADDLRLSREDRATVAAAY